MIGSEVFSRVRPVKAGKERRLQVRSQWGAELVADRQEVVDVRLLFNASRVLTAIATSASPPPLVPTGQLGARRNGRLDRTFDDRLSHNTSGKQELGAILEPSALTPIAGSTT